MSRRDKVTGGPKSIVLFLTKQEVETLDEICRAFVFRPTHAEAAGLMFRHRLDEISGGRGRLIENVADFKICNPEVIRQTTIAARRPPGRSKRRGKQ